MIQPISESGDERDKLEVLVEEFLERRRRGESPSISEYARRHRDLADSIREMFPTVAFLEGVKPQDQRGDPPAPPRRELGDYQQA